MQKDVMENFINRQEDEQINDGVSRPVEEGVQPQVVPEHEESDCKYAIGTEIYKKPTEQLVCFVKEHDDYRNCLEGKTAES